MCIYTVWSPVPAPGVGRAGTNRRLVFLTIGHKWDEGTKHGCKRSVVRFPSSFTCLAQPNAHRALLAGWLDGWLDSAFHRAVPPENELPTMDEAQSKGEADFPPRLASRRNSYYQVVSPRRAAAAATAAAAAQHKAQEGLMASTEKRRRCMASDADADADGGSTRPNRRGLSDQKWFCGGIPNVFRNKPPTDTFNFHSI